VHINVLLPLSMPGHCTGRVELSDALDASAAALQEFLSFALNFGVGLRLSILRHGAACKLFPLMQEEKAYLLTMWHAY
jgi:hypothetical protein